MKNYLVTDKLFPFDADGGTAFTAYEWATELDKNFGTCVVLYHGKKIIDKTLLPFEVIEVKNLSVALRMLNKLRADDKIFLNSAFKRFEILYLFAAITARPSLYWLCHGSLDYTLCRGIKKIIYVNLWSRLLGAVVDGYISNSDGEHQKLPPFIKKKSFVIENLFPIHTIALESLNNDANEGHDGVRTGDGYSLIFGRIDPKKKIVETIERLNALAYFQENKLKIVGVASNPSYVVEITSLIEKLEISKSCELIVSLTRGTEKIQLLKRASNLLLFSDSEGLPVVILEAIVLGTKIVCSPGCNVNHLVPLVQVVELDQLSLSDLLDDNLSCNNYDTHIFDTGRQKLAKFFQWL